MAQAELHEQLEALSHVYEQDIASYEREEREAMAVLKKEAYAKGDKRKRTKIQPQADYGIRGQKAAKPEGERNEQAAAAAEEEEKAEESEAEAEEDEPEDEPADEPAGWTAGSSDEESESESSSSDEEDDAPIYPTRVDIIVELAHDQRAVVDCRPNYPAIVIVPAEAPGFDTGAVLEALRALDPPREMTLATFVSESTLQVALGVARGEAPGEIGDALCPLAASIGWVSCTTSQAQASLQVVPDDVTNEAWQHTVNGFRLAMGEALKRGNELYRQARVTPPLFPIQWQADSPPLLVLPPSIASFETADVMNLLTSETPAMTLSASAFSSFASLNAVRRFCLGQGVSRAEVASLCPLADELPQEVMLIEAAEAAELSVDAYAEPARAMALQIGIAQASEMAEQWSRAPPQARVTLQRRQPNFTFGTEPFPLPWPATPLDFGRDVICTRQSNPGNQCGPLAIVFGLSTLPLVTAAARDLPDRLSVWRNALGAEPQRGNGTPLAAEIMRVTEMGCQGELVELHRRMLALETTFG
jgi:hypothetical protein